MTGSFLSLLFRLEGLCLLRIGGEMGFEDRLRYMNDVPDTPVVARTGPLQQILHGGSLRNRTSVLSDPLVFQTSCRPSAEASNGREPRVTVSLAGIEPAASSSPTKRATDALQAVYMFAGTPS